MGTAKVFRSGNSQAVRLPKQFRLKSKEVEIFRRGDEIVLREKKGDMVRAFELLGGMPDDLEIPEREKDHPQKRKGLWMDARFLLDTKICIYIRQKKPQQVLRRFQDLRLGEAAISVITYGELVFGANRSRQRVAALERLNELLHWLPALPLPETAGQTYGTIRAELASRGQMIGNNDLWIAAHALSAGLILVTNNDKEFRRVDGLKLQNWAV
jgi:tRNA(fMet)-specific endonuclease VapC